jgi:catechol 2,3-dioxygenase-like lactoylglutathione lyase family enzyme
LLPVLNLSGARAGKQPVAPHKARTDGCPSGIPMPAEPRQPGPQILSVDHVQVTIPRGAEEAGRAFYCGVLGLAEVEKPASLRERGGFWVMAGQTPVHVGTEDGVDRSLTKGHVAYRVNDLSAWRERLQHHGVAVSEPAPIPGLLRLEFRDPFGNRVELVQPQAR